MSHFGGTMCVRNYLGAIAYDLAPFLLNTWIRPGCKRLAGWARNSNRHDIIHFGSSGEGVVCDWEHTRALHVTRVFPRLSAVLLKRMLHDWPVELRESPVDSLQSPVVSFIIGHRGIARLPHLLLTLKSIAAQIGVNCECIVVEQSYEQQLQDVMPPWVRYHFTRTPSADYLYNRSWALNEGARLAKGRILILHDGDMLVPNEYAAEMKRQVDAGYDVVNLKRFIAYLDKQSSEFVFNRQLLEGPLRSEEMIANLCAGGSLGITRDAYFAIGAMDEEFVGWGGEDTEFWDRCQTLRVANHTYMPIVHLWHPSQPGKAAANGLGKSTAELFTNRMKISTADRIGALQKHMTTL